MKGNNFKSELAEAIFNIKYSHGGGDSWHNLCTRLVDDVCGGPNPLLSASDRAELVDIFYTRKALPGGRYLYYAGRDSHFWNNCYLLKAEEDTREEWGNVLHRASDCLMSGGGIGVDYSLLRARGAELKATGGIASGPIPLMQSINEIGRNVMQGGSRRSAIYASLDWRHGDVNEFLSVKNWDVDTVARKAADFNAHAPLDHTNISLNYGDEWVNMPDRAEHPTFVANVRQAMMTGEPGFSFNFGEQSNETLRNACCEVVSEDDSDVCNLASLNFAEIADVDELSSVTRLVSKFLLCGTLRADLPYQKVHDVRARNRRLGLGIMGLHEWLLIRGYDYAMNKHLATWLKVYERESALAANEQADWVGCSRPVAYRAIAPTGSISMLAAPTSGIEPVIYTAYKRRYLTNGTDWKYQVVVDTTARTIVDSTGIDPETIETSVSLASDPEKRIRFQHAVQGYVDMAISSTLNLPPWGSADNNEDGVDKMAKVIADYAPGLRGLTCYPDGSRGGQPIEQIPYAEAIGQEGVEYAEHDICEISGGGTCAS